MLPTQYSVAQPGVLTQTGLPVAGAVQSYVPGGVGVVPGTVGGVVPGTVGGVVPGTVGGVYPGTVAGVVPGTVGSVVPGSVTGVVPGTVAGVVPGTVGSVVPGSVAGVVPGTVGGVYPGTVAGVVPGAVPGVYPGLQVTPYVQPLGSRHPIEQNHIGGPLAPATFATLGGSPYGRISQVVALTPGVATTVPVTTLGVANVPVTGLGVAGVPGVGLAGVDSGAYIQYADMLRNACQGAGTDEDTIVNIIARTTNPERAMIRRVYTQKYNEDLVTRLQSELSGDFKEAAIGSFMTPTEYDAYCLNAAMKGLGTKEGVLTEIIGSRTPQELLAIKQTYAANYGETLDNAVAGDTSGDYQKLLLHLLQCQRSNVVTPDATSCMQDAAALYQAGEGKWGTDEATFYRVFANRSPAELAVINQYYKQNSNKGLLGAINSEFSGDTKDLLDTIVRSNVDPYGFYAGRIHDSVSGVGTNDSRLIRNICARHAVDLPLIKQAYARDYGKDMLSDIQSDTSGHYRQVLSSLVANAR